MAKVYGSKRSSRRGTSVPHQVMVMVVTFILGYFTASIFDIDTLSHWMTTQVLDNHEVKQQPVKNQAQHLSSKPKFEFYTLLANEKGAAANQQVARSATTNPQNQSNTSTTAANAVSASPTQQITTSATVASAATTTTRGAVNKPIPIRAQPMPAKVVAAKPIAPTPPRSGNFVVQVAAFKTRNDAEHMKGLLILKGFEVSVIPISTQNQGLWFRVVIGPYPNRVLAQKAQVILAKTERLNGMVRSAGG
jgi:cell division protein FtsN